ncbi:MAG TPA: FAD-dependent oxidoreductase [Acidobacteriaceae bacterium]
MALTRRNFLIQVGQAGGYGAAFTMMQSLGLLPVAASKAATVQMSPGSGNGTKVVILGGGIAGLVSAYELGKLGYTCTLLEARDRVGGRNWTIRKDCQVEFTSGVRQGCSFTEGLYMNAGPARLPSVHETMLGYCRELGVPLEVEVNTSRSALLQSDQLNGGKAVRNRQVDYDTRGHVSELLAKCVQRGALDQELTPGDKEQMLEFLRQYGDLSPDLFYKGSERTGYKVNPDAGDQAGIYNDPLDMHALLTADLWKGLLVEDVIDWQATMFQPIGGMDQIPMAFKKCLGSVVRYRAEVVQLRQNASGVRVVYLDQVKGKHETVAADYCICAMPLTMLKSLDADFSPDLKAVIDGATYDSAYKIGWEARRFWEQEYHIYGGISYLQQTVDTVWYPSASLFSERGVVLSGYSIENGSEFGRLPDMQSKLDASRKSIELLHPGRSRELENPIYVSWGQIPYNLGSWVSPFDFGATKEYQRLIQPEGRVYFAGDHTSHLVGWQEGAALSAHRALNLIGARVAQAKTAVV